MEMFSEDKPDFMPITRAMDLQTRSRRWFMEPTDLADRVVMRIAGKERGHFQCLPFCSLICHVCIAFKPRRVATVFACMGQFQASGIATSLPLGLLHL